MPDTPSPVQLQPQTSTAAPTPTPTKTPEPPKAVSKDGITTVAVDGAVPGHEFKGTCDKCGWQTHQPTEVLARDAVHDHAKRHLMGR